MVIAVDPYDGPLFDPFPRMNVLHRADLLQQSRRQNSESGTISYSNAEFGLQGLYRMVVPILVSGVDMSSSLGRKVNALRRQKGLSLDDLAQATNSSKSYMWELENKAVARPSAEKLGRIAQVLEVTPEYLFDESRTEPGNDEADRAFFRKYQTLSQSTKDKIKGILDILDRNE